MIKDKLDKSEYNILCNIIDSTNDNYINDKINKLKNIELLYTERVKEVIDIPNYKYNKGLPIGNMTSQFFAIYYLNSLDHYIVHNLKIKYMIRYMDDYVLIHNDKNYLKLCKTIIEKKLNDEYKLELNLNKSKIYNSYDGFDFLGCKFIINNNRTIIKVSNRTFNNIKKRIRICDKSDFKKFYSTMNNYYYSFKYCSSLCIKRYINSILEEK